jgi:hypothetical protein
MTSLEVISSDNKRKIDARNKALEERLAVLK